MFTTAAVCINWAWRVLDLFRRFFFLSSAHMSSYIRRYGRNLSKLPFYRLAALNCLWQAKTYLRYRYIDNAVPMYCSWSSRAHTNEWNHPPPTAHRLQRIRYIGIIWYDTCVQLWIRLYTLLCEGTCISMFRAFCGPYVTYFSFKIFCILPYCLPFSSLFYSKQYFDQCCMSGRESIPNR